MFTTTKVHYVTCHPYCAAWYVAVFAGRTLGQAAEVSQSSWKRIRVHAMSVQM